VFVFSVVDVRVVYKQGDAIYFRRCVYTLFNFVATSNQTGRYKASAVQTGMF